MTRTLGRVTPSGPTPRPVRNRHNQTTSGTPSSVGGVPLSVRLHAVRAWGRRRGRVSAPWGESGPVSAPWASCRPCAPWGRRGGPRGRVTTRRVCAPRALRPAPCVGVVRPRGRRRAVVVPPVCPVEPPEGVRLRVESSVEGAGSACASLPRGRRPAPCPARGRRVVVRVRTPVCRVRGAARPRVCPCGRRGGPEGVRLRGVRAGC